MAQELQQHLIPQVILDLAGKLRTATDGSKYAYLGRMETIRDYVIGEISAYNASNSRIQVFQKKQK